MITSMVTGMVRPSMVSAMVNPLASFIRRYFAELDSVQQSHYVYANTLVFQSGDTFEFDFLAPTGAVAANEYLTDDTGGSRAWFVINAAGSFSANSNIGSMTLDGISVSLSSSYPVDGKLHKIELTYSGAASVSILGAFNTLASGFYNGIIANPAATISGVTTTNPIGLATGNIEYPAENVFGVNDASDLSSPSSVNSELTYDDSGGVQTLTANSTVAYPSARFDNKLVVGQAYEVTATIDCTGSSAQAFVGVGDILDTARTRLVGSAGVVTTSTAILYTDNNGNIMLLIDSGAVLSGDVVKFSGVSIRSITNAITYVNIPDAQIEKVALIDGSWIGQELWVDLDVSFFSSAEQTELNSPSEGDFRIATTGGVTGIENIGILDGVPTALASFNITTQVTGSLNIADMQGSISDVGEHSFTLDTSSINNLYIKRQGGATDISLNNISVKRKIEIA